MSTILIAPTAAFILANSAFGFGGGALAATITAVVATRCRSDSSYLAICISLLSRQVAVWLCPFRFNNLYLAPKQLPAKACHRSFFLGYYYYCCDLCRLWSRGCPMAPHCCTRGVCSLLVAAAT